MKQYRGVLGPLGAVLLFIIGMRFSPFEPHREPAGPTGAPVGTVSWDDRDWDKFESTVRMAAADGVDTLLIGEAMAHVGRTLVGTAYVPQTLEAEGDERLVITFRGLDCVTFVENVFALAVVVKAGMAERLGDRAAAEAEYSSVLTTLRYRSGLIDGYASRLHYFTDWIGDNQRKGIVTDITAELGGVTDRDPVDFMSSHVDAYRQLADERLVDDIREAEARLTARGRVVIPQERVAAAAHEIRNGDIIAATSTVDGLDVAHTGLALWVDGTLRLMHAPLVGEAVQISDVSVADRLLSIGGQDGVIVVRPIEPRRPARSSRAAGR